jgi:ubiquitin
MEITGTIYTTTIKIKHRIKIYITKNGQTIKHFHQQQKCS